jgi:hypothetical protein
VDAINSSFNAGFTFAPTDTATGGWVWTLYPYAYGTGAAYSRGAASTIKATTLLVTEP